MYVHCKCIAYNILVVLYIVHTYGVVHLLMDHPVLLVYANFMKSSLFTLDFVVS